LDQIIEEERKEIFASEEKSGIQQRSELRLDVLASPKSKNEKYKKPKGIYNKNKRMNNLKNFRGVLSTSKHFNTKTEVFFWVKANSQTYHQNASLLYRFLEYQKIKLREWTSPKYSNFWEINRNRVYVPNLSYSSIDEMSKEKWKNCMN
jgi:hypothetical protein